MSNASEQPTDDSLSALAILQANLNNPAAFARQLFNLNYERTKADDPELAEMMRACAIPRAFNAEVIGVLRDQREDRVFNERLLAGLLAFRFILIGQGSDNYIYHANTREMLLDEWGLEENHAQFDQYKARLVAFYQAQGEAAYKERLYENALQSFNRAIGLQTDKEILYEWRGQTQLKLGAYQAAQADLEQALISQVVNAELYFNLGTAHYYLGNYSSCIAALTKVIEFGQTNAVVYNNRGAAYKAQQNYEKALVDYSEAIRLNPQFADAFYNLGIIYDNLKEHEKALDNFTQASRLNPQYNTILERYEVIYNNLKADEMSRDNYAETIHLLPFSAIAPNRDRRITKFYYLIVPLIVWFSLLFNIDRFTQQLHITPFFYCFTAICAVLIILFPPLHKMSLQILFVLALLPYFALKYYFGFAMLDATLSVTLIEINALGLTIVLSALTGRRLEELQETLISLMIVSKSQKVQPFETGQALLYREVRRARRHQRPLALLAISPVNSLLRVSIDEVSGTVPSNRIVEDVQHEIVKNYIFACLANLLIDQLEDSCIVTQREEHFVTLIPEASREDLQSIVKKLENAAEEKLGIKLRIGISTFPDDEITFEALVERAEATMNAAKTNASEPVGTSYTSNDKVDDKIELRPATKQNH